MGKNMANDGQLQLVTFYLGEELYGVDIMEVNGIINLQEVRPIPNAPIYVDGILNIRGDIMPVINLHKRFNLKGAQLSKEDQLKSGFVILKVFNMKLAIYIDQIAKVVTVDIDKMQPPPQMLTGIGAEYIQGVFHEEKGYLIILDIKRLFNPNELKQLEVIGT
jgi:purine-binding chemotaxis protein CheW